jgi:putative ABC transport system permease protein
MGALGLALRLLAREWKSGELGVLLLALTVAVSALTGVGFLVNRIGQAVEAQATEVLAADLRLESPRALPERYREEAGRRGLASSKTTSILSMVFLGDANQLSNVRAVAEGYPLRGRIGVSDTAFGAVTLVTKGPKPGEAWPESKLLATLDAKPGDEISVGAAKLRVTRVLISRPDQGGGFAELAPSIMINAADLPATELLQPGSRASHAQLFSGTREQVARFKTWLEANKQSGERLLDITEASPQIRNATDRAARFLSLASLVAVLLCSIAVAMAARRYVQRHLDSVALMKTLGASRGYTLAVSLSQLLSIAVVAALLGSAVGYLAQQWLISALRELIQAELPPPDLTPLGLGFLTSIAVLAGFALPPLLQLSRVPAIRVLRHDVGPPPPLLWLAFGPAVLAVGFLIWWVTRDLRLFVGFVIGLAAFLLLLATAGAVLVRLAAGLRGSVGVSWRYGVANLSRRRAESVVQIVAFGVGIMVLLLLAVVRDDLLADWRKSLPEDIPNYFFINIPPHEHEAFQAFLDQRGAERSKTLPMIRARLTRINGTPIDELSFANPRAQGFAERDQNITWSAELGNDNRIVAGRWWREGDVSQPLVSIATEFQEALGLEVGDRLTFDVAGEVFEARVASVRKVKWDSFQPNFMLVFPPGLLEGTAGTWMTSAYFRPTENDAIAELVRRFPSVSVFDLEDLLGQVRSVIDKAALAVQSVFVFTLFAGLTVLLAAVQASREERRFESAMLRTLGASRRTVFAGVLAEFTTLGLLAGLLAALGASLAGFFVAREVLEIPYGFDAWVWVAGLAGGAILVATAGWLATRSVVTSPPSATLRGG